MSFLNAGLSMARSFYVATANDRTERPAAAGLLKADLVVVGGGATGLSAALFAARAGRKVVLLEGGRVGWGASGRNGGQLIPGLRKGAAELVHLFGKERARALFDLSLSARSLVLDLCRDEGIDCDLRLTGHILAGVKPSDQAGFEEEARALEGVMGYPHARVLDRADARAAVASPEVLCALVDDLGGHMHPLNYTLGLARAAQRAGVRIFEMSRATGLDRSAKGVRVTTPDAVIEAAEVILAGDALLSGLFGRVNQRIMPVANYVVTTEPLQDPTSLIPRDQAVSDSRFVVDYFRLTPDGRLLFGGGERYTPDPPADIESFVRPYVERAFPQLKGVRIEHAWGGMVSVTFSRLPHVGRDGPVLWAHGYSGQGALLSTLGGKILADALNGDAGPMEALAALEPPAFPGGPLARWPLYVAGMLWYALRDRLG